jgi:hypothetical protein
MSEWQMAQASRVTSTSPDLGLRQFDLFDGKRLAKGMGDGGFDTGHFGSIEIVPQG